jgi:hypothetical protein
MGRLPSGRMTSCRSRLAVRDTERSARDAEGLVKEFAFLGETLPSGVGVLSAGGADAPSPMGSGLLGSGEDGCSTTLNRAMDKLGADAG